MCLTKVTKVYENRPREVKTGYKVVSVFNRQQKLLSSIYYRKWFEIGIWYTDFLILNIVADDQTIYPTGFHLFTTLEDAEKYRLKNSEVVCKVEYDEVIAEGTQYDNKCELPTVVAKKIRFIEIVN